MKSLKTAFSSLLLLLVICQVAPVQAAGHVRLPIYQNTIANISLGYEDAMLAGSIKLDNGMLMHIVDYKTRDDNVMKTWQVGDVVLFQSHVKDEALILSAKRLKGQNEEVEPYLICDVTKQPKNSLAISEINNDGKFVKLSDGTVWEFSWYNHLSTKKWSIGERVIVQGQGDKNSYEFINIDAPVSLNVASAKATFVLY